MGGPDWHWGLSNIGQHKLLLWLEPWGEEFEVEGRSTVTLKVSNPQADARFIDVQSTEDHVVIWANGGDLIEVQIDQVRQDSASARIAFPDMPPGLSTKEFLNIVFSQQPDARLAGRKLEPPEPFSFWSRLKRRLGLNRRT